MKHYFLILRLILICYRLDIKYKIYCIVLLLHFEFIDDFKINLCKENKCNLVVIDKFPFT